MSKITLPPDPDGQNADRASWAYAALVKFQKITRTDDGDALSDLLCDLMHFCDRSEIRLQVDYENDFYAALARAQGHYDAETYEAPGEKDGC